MTMQDAAAHADEVCRIATALNHVLHNAAKAGVHIDVSVVEAASYGMPAPAVTLTVTCRVDI